MTGYSAPPHFEGGSPSAPVPSMLFPPGIFCLLKIVDISIHFNDRICPVATEIRNKTCNVLSPAPRSGREPAGAVCLPKWMPHLFARNSRQRIFPAGVMARRSSRERCFFLWNTIIVINRLAHFPLGKVAKHAEGDGGIGPAKPHAADGLE
jgi:hypothetical protein